MLSEQEYNNIQWQLDHIPSTITGKQRQNLRANLRKKLKEHQLASTYPPFEPLPHSLYFINYATPEHTLHELIQMITSSSNFTLDTESVNIYKQGNKPVLIQLQVLLSRHSSAVVLCEMKHLPSENTNKFILIKKFFETLLQYGKNIYIWGQLQELVNFKIFRLFSEEQCYLPNVRNLQNIFKYRWQQAHTHTSQSDCICEQCLNISSSDLWGLQDAVAFQLHEWLDKRLSVSSFHIGLDPNLFQINEREKIHRENLTSYAAADCLSMQRILISLDLLQSNNIIPPPRTITTTNQNIFNIQFEHLVDDDTDDDDEIFIATSPRNNFNVVIARSPPESNNNTLNLNQHLEETSQTTPSTNTTVNKVNSTDVRTLTNINHDKKQQNPLSAEERKRIHNRSCTRKQRTRQYKHQIVKRNIYHRFTITDIKKILRKYEIEFSAINVVTSSRDDQRTLYIGIKDKHLLVDYEETIQNLFTYGHYKRFRHSHGSSSKR